MWLTVSGAVCLALAAPAAAGPFLDWSRPSAAHV